MRLLIYLSLIFLVQQALADSASKMEIDSRTACEEHVDGLESKFYLIFSVREKPNLGHAYVAWSSEDAVSRSCSSSAYGKYPREGLKTKLKVLLFSAVPGEIKEEENWADADYQLIVRIDRDIYDKTLRSAKSAKLDPRLGYRLVYDDCVEFVKNLARLAKLSIPEEREKGLTPEKFIQEFMRLNKAAQTL